MKYIISIFFVVMFSACSNTKTLEPTESNTQQNAFVFSHYYMAHRFIPSMYFCNPLNMLNTLERNHKIILSNFTNQNNHKNPLDSSIKNKTLTYTQIKRNNYRIGIIEFPEPKKSPEVYFVAFVELYNVEGDAKYRYYTLEKLMELYSGGNESVFCAWDKNHNHGNFGIGTKNKPTKKDFLKLIEVQIKENIS